MIEVPIKFWQGESFIPPAIPYTNNGSPVNLTGYTATMTARQTINAIDPPTLLATTANGMISINGPAGTIQISLPPSYTSTLPAPFTGIWDLWVYGPGGSPALRLCGGKINILLPVGRP